MTRFFFVVLFLFFGPAFSAGVSLTYIISSFSSGGCFNSTYVGGLYCCLIPYEGNAVFTASNRPCGYHYQDENAQVHIIPVSLSRLQSLSVNGSMSSSLAGHTVINDNYTGTCSLSASCSSSDGSCLASGDWECTKSGACEWSGDFSGTCSWSFGVSGLDCQNPQSSADSVFCGIPKGNPDSCATTEPAAQALLAAHQIECETKGGEFEGNVVHEDNGDYCVKETCNIYSSCPADNPAPPAQKRIVLEKKFESEPKEESTYDYSQQCKPQPFYDALGRRTEPRPETRRHLFEKRGKAAVRGMEPDMGAVLRREEPVGQCCVESFDVGLREEIDSIFVVVDNKVGVQVGFDAKFHGEEYESGCNPSCCEFKQDVKAKILKNGIYKTNGNCGTLDSATYIPDCYGRKCIHTDPNRDKYNDSLGTYEGTDFPGLYVNEEERDTVDIRMEYNSYIKDKCNAYEVKEVRYWGFHIQGIVPDDLTPILLGEIGP